MFWIKKANFKQKDGYLYLRETIYERDKRTLQKKPKKLGSGNATKQRWKHSKKKDIYCGKIEEIETTQIISFKDYIEKKNKNFLDYKINSPFDDILSDFVEYLLKIHKLDKDNFYNGKIKTYFLANGFLCRETINWIRRFNIKGNPENPNEIERFALRCKDSGVYDDEIISILYSKLIPEDKLEEMKNEKDPNLEEKTYTSMMDFMRQEHKN